MMEIESNGVFNMLDTNGRRSDVVEALTIFMKVLKEIKQDFGLTEWAAYPSSWTQYEYYKRVLELSPTVYKEHKGFDYFQDKIAQPQVREPFERYNKKIVEENLPEGKTLLKKLDDSIEKRARHYTNNLVKIGFCTKDRNITPVGNAFLVDKKLSTDPFEKILNLDKTNILYLRQLLKLRVYTNQNGTRVFYSPMKMLIYTLLKKQTISTSDLRSLITNLSPYYPIDAQDYLDDIKRNGIEKVINDYSTQNSNQFIQDLKNYPTPLEFEDFSEFFKNRKSGETKITYYEFYKCLLEFNTKPTIKNFEELKELSKLTEIKNAFNGGKSLFEVKTSDTIEIFLSKNINSSYLNLNLNNFNEIVYTEFLTSKRKKDIQEYSNEFLKVVKVTGIIYINNGIVSITNRDTWLKFVDIIKLKSEIFGVDDVIVNNGKKILYEEDVNSMFYKNIPLNEILNINADKLQSTINVIQREYQVDSLEKVIQIEKNKRNADFIGFINTKFPLDKTISLLKLFSDRSNDTKIQTAIETEASIPTIFEWLVGIAWYHFSKDTKYDVFSSFNLTMNANFLPETHAGGGNGDIIARYQDKTIQIEVTLMNANAQKRGEWEPVLRHATNLTIEESPKPVYTFFVADELDENTINIWRAVASVPLKSSKGSKNYASNVTVMPLKNLELISLLNNNISLQSLISSVHQSFSSLQTDFNIQWREDILGSIS